MASISDLPEEIRADIFRKLPQHEIVHNLRLVCKQWCSEIDRLLDFKVELDDRKAGWQRILKLRVNYCCIAHFCQPPPSGPATTTFQFPNLIRTLLISEHISPCNLFYLLADCASSLSELRISIGFHLLNFQFPSAFSKFRFERLQTLDVRLCTMKNNTPADTTDAFPFSPFINFADGKAVVRIFTDLLDAVFPFLQNFRTELNCFGFDQTSALLATVLSFLARQRQVESVDLELTLGNHGFPTSEFRPLSEIDLSRIDLIKLKEIVNLKGLRLVSSSPIGLNLLMDLLVQQKTLNYFEVDLFPVPSSIFSDVVVNNAEHVVMAEITDMCIWDEQGNCTPFDATVFAACHNLKKLILDRSVIRKRMFDTDELINLYNLPPSLDELGLNYFNVRTDELVHFVTSPVGQSIRALLLTKCGEAGEFGVNGSLLECIIQLPQLYFVEISPLNVSDPEERDHLDLIMDSIGYEPNHAYFSITKRTGEIPVRIRPFIAGDDGDITTDEDD